MYPPHGERISHGLMKDDYHSTGLKQREVGEFVYATQSWARERRVITRLEYGGQGNDSRYVVTHLTGQAQALYDDLYCQRGEAENRIKEAQVGLSATRTSCQHFQGNQLRVLLAALGYVLIERLRALALQGTALACVQVDTLRIKLPWSRATRGASGCTWPPTGPVLTSSRTP